MPSIKRVDAKGNKVSYADGCDIREALFAHAYVKYRGQAYKAARYAGYKGDLHRRVNHLLKRPRVTDEIRRQTAKLLSELNADAGEVIQELTRIARADARRLFDKNNELIPPSKLDEDTAHAVELVMIKNGHTVVKFASKIKALALLSMWLAHQQTVPPSEEEGLGNLRINFLTKGEERDKTDQ